MTDGAGYRPTLPRPSTSYSASEQQNNRVNIQFALDRKLNRNEAAVYGGLPCFIQRNLSSFTLPGNAWAAAANLSVLASNNKAFQVFADGSFKVLGQMTFKCEITATYPNTGATFNFYGSLLKNGTVISPSIAMPMTTGLTTTMAGFVIVVDAIPEDTYQLGFYAGIAGGITVPAAAATSIVTCLTSLERFKEP